MTNTTGVDDGEHPTTLDVTHARQGRRGRHVLWVLLVGLVLVVLALGGTWLSRSDELATTEPNNARQASDAAAFNAPDPAVKVQDQMMAPGVPGDPATASPSGRPTP